MGDLLVTLGQRMKQLDRLAPGPFQPATDLLPGGHAPVDNDLAVHHQPRGAHDAVADDLLVVGDLLDGGGKALLGYHLLYQRHHLIAVPTARTENLDLHFSLPLHNQVEQVSSDDDAGTHHSHEDGDEETEEHHHGNLVGSLRGNWA